MTVTGLARTPTAQLCCVATHASHYCTVGVRACKKVQILVVFSDFTEIMATATEKKTTTEKAPEKAPKTVSKKAAKPAVNTEEFAVIETGGKQHIVSAGETIEVELLGDHEEGDTIEFDKVLMTDDGSNTTLGTPYIAGAKVTGTYKGMKKGKKLTIVRFESKSNRDKKKGHRQKYAVVTIDSLS